MLQLLVIIGWIGGVLSEASDSCSVKIPFNVPKECKNKIQQYLHVDIAVYIDVLYMVPMQEECWKCAIKHNPDCNEAMDWSLHGECYMYTSEQCAAECGDTQKRLRDLVEQAPMFPRPPKIPEPLSSTLRQRFRSKAKTSRCLSKNQDGKFSMEDCDDNKYEQQFSLFPIKDKYLILHAPMKNRTACELKRNTDYWECNVPGCMITQCDAEGNFIPRQCHLSVGYTGTCWCVDEDGNEIDGTKTQPGEPAPKCESILMEKSKNRNRRLLSVAQSHPTKSIIWSNNSSPLRSSAVKNDRVQMLLKDRNLGIRARIAANGRNRRLRLVARARRRLLSAKGKKGRRGKGKKGRGKGPRGKGHRGEGPPGEEVIVETTNQEGTTDIVEVDTFQLDETAGLCGYGMTQHKQWDKNIIKCHATKDKCIVYEKLNQEFGGTCRQFCEGFDLQCKNGWKDQQDYHCDKGEPLGCDERDGYTSDHICECVVPSCGDDCKTCTPIAQPIYVDDCLEEVEIPEFYNVPMPDWTLARITEKCQRCVNENDPSCKTDPWVPSGNSCVHLALGKCEEECYDSNGPPFPRDVYHPANQHVCLSKTAGMDICGPENLFTIHRLGPGAVQVRNEEDKCLSAVRGKLAIESCQHKGKRHHEWLLEVVL